MSSADLHDSQKGEALIQGDEKAYYGDKAYDSKALRDTLAKKGIAANIAYKANRNKPLVNWQKWCNTTASSVRSGVERANATMKRW
jgi:transposase, IS5 family